MTDKELVLRFPALTLGNLAPVPMETGLQLATADGGQTGGGGAAGPRRQKAPPECHATGVRGTPHHPACTGTSINIQ
ncbi:hypothetical protein QQF64_010330 [Cirrhinus molitorella]|uniref:Uncharacterized protein n=1 Tax=Cirrhinus molitorella TaxID=172907 RepID=A0ABR3M3Q2_9TELE